MSFYIIWSPQGPTPPRVTFDRRWAAERVKDSMANRYPGQDFYVMKAKSHSVTKSRAEQITDAIYGLINNTSYTIQEHAKYIDNFLKNSPGLKTKYFGKWHPGRPGAKNA
jgi:hypothetical protein